MLNYKVRNIGYFIIINHISRAIKTTQDGSNRLNKTPHMIIRSQNTLYEDNRITGIPDWYMALWGDQLIEIAVLDYLGFGRPSIPGGLWRLK